MGLAQDAAVWRLIAALVLDIVQALLGGGGSRGGGAGAPPWPGPKRGARWLARDVVQELQDRGDQFGPGSLRVVLAAATSPVQPGALDVAHVLEADLGSPSANRSGWPSAAAMAAAGSRPRGVRVGRGARRGAAAGAPMAAAERLAYLYRHARLAELRRVSGSGATRWASMPSKRVGCSQPARRGSVRLAAFRAQ